MNHPQPGDILLSAYSGDVALILACAHSDEEGLVRMTLLWDNEMHIGNYDIDRNVRIISLEIKNS